MPTDPPRGFRFPAYCRFWTKQRRERGAQPLAYVRVEGRVRYLGEYDSATSHKEYARLQDEYEAKWKRAQAEFEADAAAGGPTADSADPVDDPQLAKVLDGCRKAGRGLSVVELCEGYFIFAQGYYRKGGRSSGQLPHVIRAIKITNELYGDIPAVDFGPRALRTIQARLVKTRVDPADEKSRLRYARKTVNGTCEIVKRLFKWGVSHELVPESVYRALTTVPGIQPGRTAARESAPIMPVSDETVNATLPYLSTVVADMCQFQRLTGCRPGEVCDIRPMDLDRGGKVWKYQPATHKTQHRGRERVIFIGPQAQKVLRPYLLRSADAYCFSPAESVAKHDVEKRARRKTRVQPSQWDRRKARPERVPSTHYERSAYQRAIAYGVAKANRAIEAEAAREGIEPRRLAKWHPIQLRHSAATDIRRRFGLEAAQTVLGHASADVTQVYAERDNGLAADVMEKIG